MVLVALEVEHRVDHVLEDARTGDGPLLRDVADERDGHTGRLGELDQPRRALAHLRDAAGRRADGGPVDHLDRVDHREVGLRICDVCGDGVGIGLGQGQDAVGIHAQAVGPPPHLHERLLAGDVERPQTLAAQPVARLEEQRRLPDAGVAADQDGRAAHDPAAQHAVELADARAQPRLSRRRHL